MAIAETLRGLIVDELAKRSEPWARRFIDVAAGAPYDEVVETLARVGTGVERDSVGDPLSDEAFREHLAAWLVDTVLVNPNLSKNTYRPQLQTGVRVQLEAYGEGELTARALDTLAELALGAYEETHPRAVRIAGPDRVVAAYLRGAPPRLAPGPIRPAVRGAQRARAVRGTSKGATTGGAKSAAATPGRAKRRPAGSSGAVKRRATSTHTGPKSKPAARKRASAKTPAKKRARARPSAGVRRGGTAQAKARRKKK